MILRRVIAHFKKQEWTAIALDFLIVVMGVFIGLQVNNWNEARENAQIADGYLERVREDLKLEKSTYEHFLNYVDAARGHAQAALHAYSRPGDELGAEFLIDLYQASQRWNVTLRRGAYDELLATGRIGLISDVKLRSALNNYYEASGSRRLTLERDTNAPYRQILRMSMDEMVQAAIRKKCDDVYVVTEDNNTYLTLPTECDVDLPDSVVRSAVDTLHADENVRQNLRFQLAVLDSVTGSVANGIATADALLADLEGGAP